MSTASRLSILFPFPKGKALGVLIAAVLILLISVIGIELPVLRYTHGNVLFPLDNAYVNITVARNLAFYQVWGVSKYAFQSAATSLLYPVTLAPLFFIFGAHLIIPLIVNFFAGAYFLLMLQRTLIRYKVKPTHQLFVLLGATIVTLLPLLIVSGMEYTLQLLFVFLFIDTLAQTLAPPAPEKTRPLYLFGLLAVAARYEDLLIIAIACLLLTRKKAWQPAAKLAAIGIAPILVFGAISLTKKSSFLPNAMLAGPYPVYTGLMHFQRDCDRIYDEQYPTAGFVHLYYNKSTVGVNQPGAVSYFSEGRKLDYTGIASNDVTKKRAEHAWSPLWADSLSKLDGIRVAIVADPWFSPDQLPKWKRVASWDIPDGETGKKVTFYVINDYDTSWLRKNLHNYQHLLPSNVSVSYY